MSTHKYQTSSGELWRAVAQWRDPVTGERQRREKRGFPRQKDAKQWERDVLALARSGDVTQLDRAGTTVAEHAATWLASIDAQAEAGMLAKNTRADYRRSIVKHVLPKIGDMRLQRVTGDDLTTLYAELMADGLAPKTIGNIAGAVHLLLDSARRAGIVAVNRAGDAKRPKVEHVEPPILTPAQVGVLLDWVGDNMPDDLALLIVTAMTGCRRGEILGLTWDGLDVDAGTVRVVQQVTTEDGQVVVKKLKTGHKGRRTLPLHPVVMAALKGHRARQAEQRLAVGDGWQDYGLIFARADGTPVRPKALNDLTTRALKGAGLPHVTVHQLRHSFASALLDAGEPLPAVSKLLGHASTQITASVYSHMLEGADRQAVDRLGDSIFGQDAV